MTHPAHPFAALASRCAMATVTALTALATLGLLAPAAHAQDASLYRALGEKPGLEKLVDDFVGRLQTDPRMKPFFEKSDRRHLSAQLVAQVCQVSGGPCQYKGPDMKTAHNNMDITRGDFNALVEVLQQAMDAQGIPFGAQNRLLAVLAPMHRDVINTR